MAGINTLFRETLMGKAGVQPRRDLRETTDWIGLSSYEVFCALRCIPNLSFAATSGDCCALTL